MPATRLAALTSAASPWAEEPDPGHVDGELRGTDGNRLVQQGLKLRRGRDVDLADNDEQRQSVVDQNRCGQLFSHAAHRPDGVVPPPGTGLESPLSTTITCANMAGKRSHA